VRVLPKFQTKKNMKIKILLGPAGCGKTFAAQQRAQELGARYFEYLMHAWVSAEDLFYGVNVSAAVKGDGDNALQLGVLAQAAIASQTEAVVLCLDELDKASEKAENLLLQFLQSGVVPTGPDSQTRANLQNLEVFITSNGVREHGDPLLRRCERVWMNPISEATILNAMSQHLSYEQCKVLMRAVQLVEKLEKTSVSLQECVNLAVKMQSVTCFEEFKTACKGFIARTRTGAEFIDKAPQFSTFWGLLK